MNDVPHPHCITKHCRGYNRKLHFRIKWIYLIGWVWVTYTFYNNGYSLCIWYTFQIYIVWLQWVCLCQCISNGREENNIICTKLYRAYTIEFPTQFNELFFFFEKKIFPIILSMWKFEYITQQKKMKRKIFRFKYSYTYDDGNITPRNIQIIFGRYRLLCYNALDKNWLNYRKCMRKAFKFLHIKVK